MLVAGGLELTDRGLDVLQERAVGVLALRLVVQPHADDLRAERRDRVAASVRLVDRGSEHLVGLGELSEVHQRLARLHEQLDGERITVRERRCRAAEQVVRGGEVSAVEGAAARRAQVRRGAPAQRHDVLVLHPELGADLVRLFQVEPADLLVFQDAVARRRLDPVDERHVELRARALQQSAVGGVADQRVEELERLFTDQRALVRADQLLDRERLQARRHLGLHRRRHQRLDAPR